jgi:hypothetical protein
VSGESIAGMWIHLYHFLVRVAHYAVTLGGTSQIGFFGLLLLPPIISGWESVRKKVKSGVRVMDALEQMKPASLFKKPVFIIWSCLIVWSFAAVTYNDHEYLVQTNAKNKPQLNHVDNSQPDFTGKILTTYIADNANGQPVLSTITMFINHGAPSILLVDKVWVKFADGRKVFGQAVIEGSGDSELKATPGAGGTDLRLKHDDFLPNKALEHPVTAGGDVIGWTMNVFPTLTRKELLEINTRVFIQCLDANNNPVVVDRLINGN